MTERSSGMRWHCSSYIRVWFQPNWHLLFPFCIPGCHPVNSRNSRKTGDTCLWGIVSPWSSVLLQPWYGSYIFLEGPSSILLSFTSITNFTFSLKYPIADACTFRLCLSQLHLYFISHSLAYNSLNDKPSLCCHVFLFAGSNMTIKLEIRAHVIHLFFTLHPLFFVCSSCVTLCFLSYRSRCQHSPATWNYLQIQCSFFPCSHYHTPTARSVQAFYLKLPKLICGHRYLSPIYWFCCLRPREKMTLSPLLNLGMPMWLYLANGMQVE